MTAVAARTVRVVRPLAHMLIGVDMVLSPRDPWSWTTVRRPPRPN
jgi:hypothetical protein